LDDDGFTEFATARLGALSRIAYLLTGDHDAAEDLLQNALVIVASKWRKVAAADDRMAYVRRILYHELVSSWRRSRYLREELSTAHLPERSGERDEASDTVHRLVIERALSTLPPRQRAVIVLRYYEDLSEAEVAEALGCSVGTVKSQAHHALARLRETSPELAELARRDAWGPR
jgi:RNA polymerase sigma-70 factor (sigma-E family)